MEKLKNYLTENEWKFQNYGLDRYSKGYFYKKFDTKTLCKTNDSMQIVINCYEFDEKSSYNIELRAEKQDGKWVILQVYGLSENDIYDDLDNQIEQLLWAWEAMNNIVHKNILKE